MSIPMIIKDSPWLRSPEKVEWYADLSVHSRSFDMCQRLSVQKAVSGQ